MVGLDEADQHGAIGICVDRHDDQHRHDRRDRGAGIRRVELITGRERRRQWTAEEKAQIIGESFEAGANVSAVARRHGLSIGLLHHWRRALRQGAANDAGGMHFVPVMTAAMVESESAKTSSIEIEVAGAVIRVNGDVDPAALKAVLAAVRAA